MPLAPDPDRKPINRGDAAATRLQIFKSLVCRVRRPVRVAAGLLLFALGIFLGLRPMTSLRTVAFIICCGIAALVLTSLGRRLRLRLPVVAHTALILILGLLVWMVFEFPLIGSLPTLATATLFGYGFWRAVTVRRYRFLVREIAYVTALFGVGVLAFTWPDLTSILLGAGLAISMVINGIRLMLLPDLEPGSPADKPEQPAGAPSRGERVGTGAGTSAPIGELGLTVPAPLRAEGPFPSAWRSNPTGVNGPIPPEDATVPRDSLPRHLGWLRETRRWVAVAVLVFLTVGAAAITRVMVAESPRVTAFYDTPENLPGEPGQLLRVEPYAGSYPADVQAWQMLYTTTDSTGHIGVGSAVVAHSKADFDGPAPVVGWTHGTTGAARACAPSLSDQFWSDANIPALTSAMDQGWVLVAPDFIGQGTEGIYPYLVGQGQAYSTLDALRAARQIDLNGRELGADNLIWGHSQGGHAALWTSQLAQEYAPELTITGTAAIAPASDLVSLAQRIFAPTDGPQIGALVGAYTLAGYVPTYPDITWENSVNPGGQHIIAQIAQRCIEPAAAVSLLSLVAVQYDAPLLTLDLQDGPTAAHLAQNTSWGPYPSDVWISWGTSDDVIADSIQRRYTSELCESVPGLRFTPYPDQDHAGIISESTLPDDLLEWSRQQLAGIPQESSCS